MATSDLVGGRIERLVIPARFSSRSSRLAPHYARPPLHRLESHLDGCAAMGARRRRELTVHAVDLRGILPGVTSMERLC
jgi:hypothetical protein